MDRLKFVVFAAILAWGTKAIATPIFVVGTPDGFVIGTNSVDSGGLAVCKIHYAGTTAILRSTNAARWISKRDPYDSTLEEWKVLDSKNDLGQITFAVKGFFVKSTERMADLIVKGSGSQTREQILDAMTPQHIIVAGFAKGMPELKGYRLRFVSGNPRYENEPIDQNFNGKAMMWVSDSAPPDVQRVPKNVVGIDNIHEFVAEMLDRISRVQKTTSFNPPWEIIYVTNDGVRWLEGNQNLCEKNRKNMLSK